MSKKIDKVGEWKVVTGTSKMPLSAFRLTKRASYQLGRNWHWRVDELSGDGMAFRLLTAFRTDTEECLAWLATPVGEGLRMLARLEYHGDHPGWHCHSTCADHEELPVGETDPYAFKRAPKGFSNHRRIDSVKTESDAIQKAFRFYGVSAGKNWKLA